MTMLLRPASPPLAIRRRGRSLAPTLVGLGGFALSEIGNWVPSVWYDEAATITSSTRSWGGLWAEIHNVDAVHAAYYALMHVVFAVFGYSPLTLRLPSAIAVGVTAALVILLVRHLSDSAGLAVIAGILYCLLPRVTWMGGEGRSYAISALLAVALTLLFVTALRSPRRMWWVAYSACVVLSCTVFLYLALIVVAQAVTVGVLAMRGDRVTRRAWADWARAVGVAVALLVPFALLVVGEKAQVSWIKTIGWQTISQVLVTQWFWGTALLPIIAWALILLGGFVLRGGWRSLSLGSVILPSLVLPTVILVAVSAVTDPLYSPRYLAMCAPFVAIVMAVAVARLRSSWMTAAVFAVVVSLALPHLVLAQRAPDAKEHSSWSQVASLIAAQRESGDPDPAILYGPLRFHASATTRVIATAYPSAFEGTTDVTLLSPASASLWETHTPLERSLSRVADVDTVFLITSTKQDRRLSTAAALATVGLTADRSWHFTDVNVVRYERG
jgi:mannosyltransferase